jgi:serine protease Do
LEQGENKMKRLSVVAVALVVGLSLGIYVGGPFIHGQVTQPVPTPKELTSFRNVVKTVLPAVVSIEARSKVVKTKSKQPREVPFDRGQIPEEFRRFFEDFGRMPEQFRFPDQNDVPRLGFGSGFFVDPSGVILTNYHVIEGADQVTVTLPDGRKFNSKNIRGDRRTDLAIVILDQKGPFPALALADSDNMEIGDRVLAVGAPFGLTGSVTAGIISAKGRDGLNMNKYEDFLQTDAAINPGNSGGPLINLEGKVVGINSAIKSRSGGFQGVGLAIASNLVKRVLPGLRTDGVVHRGYLGVQIRDLSPEVAARLNLPKDTGVVVADVFENTPAAKAGMKAGDILTNLAGKKIKDAKTLQGIVVDLPLKHAAEAKLIRDSQPVTVQVTIEEQPTDFGYASAPVQRQPQAAPGSVTLANVGVEVSELTDTTAEDLGFKTGTRGVVITGVEPGTSAAEAGLRKGMLIAKVDNHKVSTAAQLQQTLQTASLERGVLLQVQSPQGGTNYVLLKSGSTSE